MMPAEWDLEAEIREWRDRVGGRDAIGRDVDELEAHLRDRIDELSRAGLAPDEAFLIAVKRMGSLDELSREFAREHSDRLWKQLVPPADRARGSSGLIVATALAVLAGLLVKIPELFSPDSGVAVAGRDATAVVNGILLVLAVLAAFFVVRARPAPGAIVAVAATFVVAAVVLNGFPFEPGGMTWQLAAMHACVALWLCAGILYTGGDWRSGRARMDFIRFTGEWVVYYALIALGGAVLILLTVNLFAAIGIDASIFVQEWMLPCGAAGAVIIAAWLVEAKQAVIENIAPVLTKVFTPLFTLLLIALIVAGILQGSLIDVDRDLLILFDVALIVVLGLLLYAMSARDPLAPPDWFDRLQLVLLASALIVDVIVLVAMLSRIAEFGATANKVASLGLNAILLVNLAGAAYLHLRFLLGRTPFATLERWQTAYVPVYLVWATVVVLVFPPAFGYA